MKDLPVTRGRRYITALVAEGEHDHQDFKYAVSDARKIARSISAFANAGGGRLLIGVKDNGAIAGVRNEEDAYVVELAAHRYCDPPQEVDFKAYSVDTGVVVIVATIGIAEARPVRVLEEDGRRRAFFRVADENIVAHPLMVRSWLAQQPLALSLDGDASQLLAVLDDNPAGIGVQELARRLPVPRRRLEEIIISLTAADIIEFTYHSPEFLIKRKI